MCLSIWKVVLEVFLADLRWVSTLLATFLISRVECVISCEICFFLPHWWLSFLLFIFLSGSLSRFHLFFGFRYQFSWLSFQVCLPFLLGRRSQICVWPRCIFSIGQALVWLLHSSTTCSSIVVVSTIPLTNPTIPSWISTTLIVWGHF